MTTITLNTTYTYHENSTSKYWRDIQCEPQTVELKTWGINKPLFIMKGVVISSHDEREIGKMKEVYLQTYMFELEEYIKNGTYTIN